MRSRPRFLGLNRKSQSNLENYTLGAPYRLLFFDRKAPFFDRIESITLQPPCDFKVLVPAPNWIATVPTSTKFTPGHDARIEVANDNQNPDRVDVQIKFSDLRPHGLR